MEQQQKLPKRSFKAPIAGVIVTASYIVALILLRGSKFGYHLPSMVAALQAMPASNLGDLLAGVFGPVSFLWLILGYLQQQQELSLNTSALLLQAHEAAKQNEHHREMAGITKQQAQTDTEALEFEKEKAANQNSPKFVMLEYKHEKGLRDINACVVILKNIGSPANNVWVLSDPNIKGIDDSNPRGFIGHNDTAEIRWAAIEGEGPHDLVLTITHDDADGRMRPEKSFNLSVRGRIVKVLN